MNPPLRLSRRLPGRQGPGRRVRAARSRRRRPPGKRQTPNRTHHHPAAAAANLHLRCVRGQDRLARHWPWQPPVARAGAGRMLSRPWSVLTVAIGAVGATTAATAAATVFVTGAAAATVSAVPAAMTGVTVKAGVGASEPASAMLAASGRRRRPEQQQGHRSRPGGAGRRRSAARPRSNRRCRRAVTAGYGKPRVVGRSAGHQDGGAAVE